MCCYLNTSHVNVNLISLSFLVHTIRYLNTSHVNVNLEYTIHPKTLTANLNTSHVNVNQKLLKLRVKLL